jgi:class 3 adenylate cyclase
MSLKDELIDEVAGVFKENWDLRDGIVVPEPEKLRLGNEGVSLDATVLYADIDGSTAIVDNFKPEFAAEVYKTYLHCAGKVIRAQGGMITAYDGDRIMAVFVGDLKNTSAAFAALKISYCVHYILNPAIKNQYPDTQFELKQTVGVDTSKLLAARIGVRGANDLVWVGRAANYAAKLTELSDRSSWITEAVYNVITEESKTHNGNSIWEAFTWNKMGGLRIYGSNWSWCV